MSINMFTEKALLTVLATTQFEIFSMAYFLTKMNVYEYQLFYTVNGQVFRISNFYQNRSDTPYKLVCS